MSHMLLSTPLKQRITLIRARLSVALSPITLEIYDNSAQHVNHDGVAAGGHYTVTVISSAFEGLTRIARHRLVYDALSDMMKHDIHALSINSYTPKECNSSSR
ncbi:BolA family protein [Candidatus Vallotia cooleyia]|uniref:BolA family protein n=1 Tax=Candidatus Vallotiella adelgis TaxID=1177211 RepID=UPI001D01606E|nr:BolA family protein [Candidatus Vallotia cooleyia]UDG82275.1 DNA-binding transcriptional regulator BolA [Candidatus Vallotia cooleyia]